MLSQHIPDNLLRVLVIVKRPLLALRYTLPEGQIRKIQMNFAPPSGCDTALENFKAAGLPIRDKDVSEVQSQQSPSFPPQPTPQERSGHLNNSQATRQQSSQDSLPGPSQLQSQEANSFRHASNATLAPFAQPSKPLNGTQSEPSQAKEDGLSIIHSRSNLSALGAAITVSSMPTMAKPNKQSRLLKSPVFHGTYEPFGSFSIKSMSAPEKAQTQQDNKDTFPHSQMLAPERTLAFSKMIDSFRREEATSQEGPPQDEPVITKPKAKKQTKPRAQPVKPRKPRAKAGVITISSDLIAPSSTPPDPCIQAKATSLSGPLTAASLPEQLVMPTDDSRKRFLDDQSVNHPKKRQAQTVTQTVENETETFSTITATERPLQVQPSRAIDTAVNTSSRLLLEYIDTLMTRYRDLPAPKPASQISKDYLAQYAVQSEDDTVKAMDDLVRKCMKDEAFEKLMEDVETAWKRIGLGFREADDNRAEEVEDE